MGTPNYPIAYIDTQDRLVYSGTFASRPSAVTSGAGLRIILSDLNYLVLRSDGTNWRTAAPITLISGCSPSGIAPTGTIGANGAISLGTGLTTTYSGGIYLAFPAGALYSGSAAGSYWCVMSTTQLGTAYNNTLSGIPTAPTSTTAIVDAGPGAYTGVTSETTLATQTILGGLPGSNGMITWDEIWANNNSAGNKTIRARVSGTQLVANALTTTQSYRVLSTFRNRESQSRNVGHPGFSIGTSPAVPTQFNIDTSADWTRTFTGQLATATDYFILDGITSVVYPGAI